METAFHKQQPVKLASVWQAREQSERTGEPPKYATFLFLGTEKVVLELLK